MAYAHGLFWIMAVIVLMAVVDQASAAMVFAFSMMLDAQVKCHDDIDISDKIHERDHC